MDYRTLQDRLLLVLQDPSAEIAALIPSEINNSQKLIADMVELPSLKRRTIVTTLAGQSWVNMPPGFSGSLLSVKVSLLDDITVHSTLESLESSYDDITVSGTIEAITIEGNILWYTPVPITPVALSIVMYQYPSDLVLDTDIPDFIPDSLHEGLLVHSAAMTLWAMIEEAEDDQQTNFKVSQFFFNTALRRLREWLGMRTDHSNNIDVSHYGRIS